MHAKIITAGAIALTLGLGGCATMNGSNSGTWATACQQDYSRNRAAATAAGALIGAAAGAAIAKDDAAGAAVGAIAGGLIGHQLSKKDDPCGYGFGGYPYDARYGYWDERAGVWRH